MPRIQIDFDNIKLEGVWWRGVIIDVQKQPELLDILKPDLRALLFAENDLEVEGIIKLDSETNGWFAAPDWHTVYYYRLALNPHKNKDSDKLPRISVDFNTITTDPRCRVGIPTHVHPELLDILRPDLRVILYERNDLEVEAVIVFDKKDYRALHGWYGLPDWSTLKDYDDATGQYLPSDRLSNR